MKVREKMALEWYQKGESALAEANIFESFIYLWISWIISSKIYLSNNGKLDNDDTDADIIIKWAKMNSEIVFSAMRNNTESIKFLTNRIGSQYKNPIVDTGNKELRKAFESLRKDISNGMLENNSKIISTNFVRLLNKIRNNLFHGGKLYSDKDDRELLNAILPTFNEIVKCAINKIASED